MELASLLEIIVLIATIVEFYSLAHHTKLERKVDEHMKLLDKHMKQLDEHIARLGGHIDSNNRRYAKNLELTDKGQDP